MHRRHNWASDAEQPSTVELDDASRELTSPAPHSGNSGDGKGGGDGDGGGGERGGGGGLGDGGGGKKVGGGGVAAGHALASPARCFSATLAAPHSTNVPPPWLRRQPFVDVFTPPLLKEAPPYPLYLPMQFQAIATAPGPRIR